MQAICGIFVEKEPCVEEILLEVERIAAERNVEVVLAVMRPVKEECGAPERLKLGVPSRCYGAADAEFPSKQDKFEFHPEEFQYERPLFFPDGIP